MIFRLPLILGILVLTVPAAECCTIPVFRYALDRWESDKFRLILPAAASQDTGLQDALRPLRANGKANLDIVTSRDAATSDQAVLLGTKEGEPVWSGKLDTKTLAGLLDSPKREFITSQILAGDSMIWVIVDSGSPLDAAEAERVEKRLKFLEQVAALPIQDPNDPDSQLGPGPPLKLKFAIQRLRPDDPEEQLLIRMLAGPAGNELTSEPFAAVIFGRGRVLGAWPLKLLDDTTIEDACMFLVGRCSCRVKGENPGWDLLLNVDWEKALMPVGPVAGESTVGDPGAVSKESRGPEVVKISAEVPVARTGGRSLDNRTVAIGIGTVALAVILLILKRR